MGRKNKLKRGKTGKKGRKDGATAPSALADKVDNDIGDVVSSGGLSSFLAKSRRYEFTKPTDFGPDDDAMTLILPPKPEMTMDTPTMEMKLASLPANKRTATSERLTKARAMIDEIESLQKSRAPRAEDNNNTMVNISELASDPSYVKECVLWINAYISSDFRVMVPPRLMMHGSPLPDCWMRITSLRPLGDKSEQPPHLINLDAICFVILLATAIRIRSTRDRFCLQIVHELHAHVEGGYDWLDFEMLKDHSETKELDESYVRFALVSVGIKCARSLYRNLGQRQLIMPFPTSFGNDTGNTTQSKSLLDSIQTFAKEQVHFRPRSPVGHWNLGWVSSQVKHNGIKHSWTAATKFYNHMADCCLMANDADDDFYRAIAGIDVALGMIIGARPLVGYTLPSGEKVQVYRDIVGDSSDIDGLMAPNMCAAREAERNEERRNREGIPPTHLEAGESVLVPHWYIRRIWNYAMQAYSKVEEFQHGSFVYGESYGWDIVENFLKQVREEEVPPRQYAPCSQVGFERSRDKGSWPCDHCGIVQTDLKECSRCKKAQYCSRECQMKAWKLHKQLCIPVKS